MTVKSAPVSERPLSTTDWRYSFGNEPGIKEDNDGTAFALTLSTNSDEAIIGSATQDSVTVVGGGYLTVLAGTTERVTVPAPTGGPRTDLIVVRYDPAWAVLPTDPAQQAAHIGPCRLFRVAGTEGGGVPVYDSTPPGVEDEVLYEITRTPGTAISSNGTTVRDRRVRTGPNLMVRNLSDRPNQGVPLGTRCYVSFTGGDYVRVPDGQGAPQWAEVKGTDSGWVALSPLAGWSPPAGGAAMQARRIGNRVQFRGVQRAAAATIAAGVHTIGVLPAGFAPAQDHYQLVPAWVNGATGPSPVAEVTVTTLGHVQVVVPVTATGLRMHSVTYLTD